MSDIYVFVEKGATAYFNLESGKVKVTHSSSTGLDGGFLEFSDDDLETDDDDDEEEVVN